MTKSVVINTRIQALNLAEITAGDCVVYWMQKDQRAEDNWALIYAIERANAAKVPVVVAFILTDQLRNQYVRHYDFMLHGLMETAANLAGRNIGFVMRQGHPPTEIARLAEELQACEVVTDQSYLALGRKWRAEAAEQLKTKLTAVCSHLIVPIEAAADKQMVGAYVLRPRLQRLLPEYLTDFPDIRVQQKCNIVIKDSIASKPVESLLRGLKLEAVPAKTTIKPGAAAAQGVLDELLNGRLADYLKRGNPNELDAQSGLSPYLHFGQISAQRVLHAIVNSELTETHPDAVESFSDELLTWRELANNFVFYNSNYRQLGGAPQWAQAQLAKHADDPRDDVYTRVQFEQAATDDPLWNAAQTEMMKTGKMHNYLRMYWGKKILEWSESPSVAIATAVYLNDKYELDGREPNGYAGILWSIAGLHDRPWFERPVYGQIRYMNANGAAKKFDVQQYIDRVRAL